MKAALSFISNNLFAILALVLMALIAFNPMTLGPLALSMAAVTVTRRRSDLTGGNRKIKLFTITVAADGDTLDTRLRKIEEVHITNPREPFTVTGTLVAGALAISDARIDANDRAVVSRVSNAGTDGYLEVAITADTATIASSSNLDTSVVTVAIFPPRVNRHTVSGGTITFGLEGDGTDVAGVGVTVIGF